MTREEWGQWLRQSQHLAVMALLLLVPLVFFTFAHDVFELNKLTVMRLFTLLALLGWAGEILLLGEWRLPASKLWLPLALVGLSSLLSTLVTNNRLTSIFGVYEDFEGILTIFNYLLLWLLALRLLRRFSEIRKYLAVIVVAGLLAGGYGVAQNFGIDFIQWNPATYSVTRLFGTLGNPNFLAAYLLMTLPLAFIWFLLSERPSIKLAMILAVFVMLLAMMFTKSRGAVYALVAEGVLLGVYLIWDAARPGSLWQRNKRWLILLVALGGLSLALPNVRSNLAVTLDRTLATLDLKHAQMTPRLYIWRSALQMIRDKPLLGSGLDTFQITFPKYRLAEYWRLEWNGTPEKAHNFFLQIGATTGLLGLGAWVWLLVVYFTVLGKNLFRLEPERRHWTLAVGLAQVGFLVQNQFSFTVVAYGSLFWFLLALGPALGNADEAAPEWKRPQERFTLAEVPGPRWMLFLGACALFLVFGLLGVRAWSSDVYFKRGMVFLARGYPEPSVAEMAKAVSLAPQREIYWVKYGIALEEAAKRAQDKVPLLKRAVEVHQHTIAMNPLNGYDYNNVGRVYKYWGDFIDPSKLSEAETACRQAAELDPYNVYFALDLASVYLSQKRWDEAERVVDRLIELFPDFAIPFSYKGYLALVRNQQEAAYEYFTGATLRNWRGDINTQASTWSNLGIVRARRSELEGAVTAFDEALKLKPHYLEARLNKALIREQQGMGLEAAKEYRYILEQAPNYPRAEELRRKLERLERGASR
ncbi:MAG: O-antigen ligase family protein [candidate division FCPU426 bacterium]